MLRECERHRPPCRLNFFTFTRLRTPEDRGASSCRRETTRETPPGSGRACRTRRTTSPQHRCVRRCGRLGYLGRRSMPSHLAQTFIHRYRNVTTTLSLDPTPCKHTSKPRLEVPCCVRARTIPLKPTARRPPQGSCSHRRQTRS